MQSEGLRCIACGGKVYEIKGRLGAPDRVVCTQPGCSFSGHGLDKRDYQIMRALLNDRYKAGYAQALEDCVSTLNKLEVTHGDRRSNRSCPHEDKRVPG